MGHRPEEFRNSVYTLLVLQFVEIAMWEDVSLWTVDAALLSEV